MLSQRHYYFNRLPQSPSFFKIIDIYDEESFLRAYVLDNIFVCIFLYILFYFTIWYAYKVIERIEEKNEEISETVERNRSRLKDTVSLKNKREEYEDIIIKRKDAQKMMSKQLDNEIRRIDSEVEYTMTKLNELEKFLSKWKLWKNCTDHPNRKLPLLKLESFEGDKTIDNQFEDIKILEPSFPPSSPPEPPPRKFGVFARPPLLHTSPTSKIGFK